MPSQRGAAKPRKVGRTHESRLCHVPPFSLDTGRTASLHWRRGGHPVGGLPWFARRPFAMKSITDMHAGRALAWLLCALSMLMASPSLFAASPATQATGFKPVKLDSDYIRRRVEIPMRDGVKLHGVILIPKGIDKAGILLTMTPYNAEALTSHGQDGKPSGSLAVTLQGYDNPADVIVQEKYIRAVVDVRGQYGSGGKFVMTHTPTR